MADNDAFLRNLDAVIARRGSGGPQALDGDTIREAGGAPDVRLEDSKARETAKPFKGTGDQPGAVPAHVSLQRWLVAHPDAVRTPSGRQDVYGRDVGDYVTPDGQSADEFQIRSGMAENGGKRGEDGFYASLRAQIADVTGNYDHLDPVQRELIRQRDIESNIGADAFQEAFYAGGHGPQLTPNGGIDERGEFGKGVDAGLHGLKQSWHGMGALLSDALGDEDGMNESLSQMNEDEANFIARGGGQRVARVEDIKSIEDGMDWVAGGLGQVITSTVPTLVTGGVGGIAARTAVSVASQRVKNRVVREVTEELRNKVAGPVQPSVVAALADPRGAKALETLAKYKMVKHAGTIGAATGAWMGSGTIESGTLYEELAARGVNDWRTALIGGSAAGALDVAGLAFAVGKVLPGADSVAVDGITKILTSGVFKHFIASSGVESGTEGLQEFIHAAAIAYEDPTFDLNGPEAQSRIINGIALGALGGAVLGGTAKVAGNTREYLGGVGEKAKAIAREDAAGGTPPPPGGNAAVPPGGTPPEHTPGMLPDPLVRRPGDLSDDTIAEIDTAVAQQHLRETRSAIDTLEAIPEQDRDQETVEALAWNRREHEAAKQALTLSVAGDEEIAAAVNTPDETLREYARDENQRGDPDADFKEWLRPREQRGSKTQERNDTRRAHVLRLMEPMTPAEAARIRTRKAALIERLKKQEPTEDSQELMDMLLEEAASLSDEGLKARMIADERAKFAHEKNIPQNDRIDVPAAPTRTTQPVAPAVVPVPTEDESAAALHEVFPATAPEMHRGQDRMTDQQHRAASWKPANPAYHPAGTTSTIIWPGQLRARDGGPSALNNELTAAGAGAEVNRVLTQPKKDGKKATPLELFRHPELPGKVYAGKKAFDAALAKARGAKPTAAPPAPTTVATAPTAKSAPVVLPPPPLTLDRKKIVAWYDGQFAGNTAKLTEAAEHPGTSEEIERQRAYAKWRLKPTAATAPAAAPTVVEAPAKETALDKQTINTQAAYAADKPDFEAASIEADVLKKHGKAGVDYFVETLNAIRASHAGSVLQRAPYKPRGSKQESITPPPATTTPVNAVSSELSGVRVHGVDEAVARGTGRITVTNDGVDVPFDKFALSVEENEAEVGYVQIADRGAGSKGIGTRAYVDLGAQLAKRGIKLVSSRTQHAPGRKLWERLAAQGHAVYNSEARRFEFTVRGQKPTSPAAATATAAAPRDELAEAKAELAAFEAQYPQVKRETKRRQRGGYGGSIAESVDENGKVKRTRIGMRYDKDMEGDDLLDATGRRGGISFEEGEKTHGFDPADMRAANTNGRIGYYPFRKHGTNTLDDLARRLHDDGILASNSLSDLVTALGQNLGGDVDGRFLGAGELEADVEARAIAENHQFLLDRVEKLSGNTREASQSAAPLSRQEKEAAENEKVITQSGHSVVALLSHLAKNARRPQDRVLARAIHAIFKARGGYPLLITEDRANLNAAGKARAANVRRGYYMESTVYPHGAVFLQTANQMAERGGEVGTDTETILHELFHAAVARAYNAPTTAVERVASARIKGVVNHLRSIERPAGIPEVIWDHITGKNGGDEVMAAVITSPEIRHELDKIPYNKYQSVLGMIVDAILKLLNRTAKVGKQTTVSREVEAVVREMLASPGVKELRPALGGVRFAPTAREDIAVIASEAEAKFKEVYGKSADRATLYAWAYDGDGKELFGPVLAQDVFTEIPAKKLRGDTTLRFAYAPVRNATVQLMARKESLMTAPVSYDTLNQARVDVRNEDTEIEAPLIDGENDAEPGTQFDLDFGDDFGSDVAAPVDDDVAMDDEPLSEFDKQSDLSEQSRIERAAKIVTKGVEEARNAKRDERKDPTNARFQHVFPMTYIDSEGEISVARNGITLNLIEIGKIGEALRAETSEMQSEADSNARALDNLLRGLDAISGDPTVWPQTELTPENIEAFSFIADGVDLRTNLPITERDGVYRDSYGDVVYVPAEMNLWRRRNSKKETGAELTQVAWIDTSGFLRTPDLADKVIAMRGRGTEGEVTFGAASKPPSGSPLKDAKDLRSEAMIYNKEITLEDMPNAMIPVVHKLERVNKGPLDETNVYRLSDVWRRARNALAKPETSQADALVIMRTVAGHAGVPFKRGDARLNTKQRWGILNTLMEEHDQAERAPGTAGIEPSRARVNEHDMSRLTEAAPWTTILGRMAEIQDQRDMRKAQGRTVPSDNHVQEADELAGEPAAPRAMFSRSTKLDPKDRSSVGAQQGKQATADLLATNKSAPKSPALDLLGNVARGTDPKDIPDAHIWASQSTWMEIIAQIAKAAKVKEVADANTPIETGAEFGRRVPNAVRLDTETPLRGPGAHNPAENAGPGPDVTKYGPEGLTHLTYVEPLGDQTSAKEVEAKGNRVDASEQPLQYSGDSRSETAHKLGTEYNAAVAKLEEMVARGDAKSLIAAQRAVAKYAYKKWRAAEDAPYVASDLREAPVAGVEFSPEVESTISKKVLDVVRQVLTYTGVDKATRTRVLGRAGLERMLANYRAAGSKLTQEQRIEVSNAIEDINAVLNSGAPGAVLRSSTGDLIVYVDTAAAGMTPQHWAAVLLHEFGHVAERATFDAGMNRRVPRKNGELDLLKINNTLARLLKDKDIVNPDISEMLQSRYGISKLHADVIAEALPLADADPDFSFNEWMADQWVAFAMRAEVKTSKGITALLEATKESILKIFDAFAAMLGFKKSPEYSRTASRFFQYMAWKGAGFDVLLDGTSASADSVIQMLDAKNGVVPPTGFRQKFETFAPLYITQAEAEKAAGEQWTKWKNSNNVAMRMYNAAEPRVSPTIQNGMRVFMRTLGRLLLWNAAYIKSTPNLHPFLRTVADVFDSGQFHHTWLGQMNIWSHEFTEAVGRHANGVSREDWNKMSRRAQAEASLNADETEMLRKALIAGVDFNTVTGMPERVKRSGLAVRALNKRIYDTTRDVMIKSGGQSYVDKVFKQDPTYFHRRWNAEAILATDQSVFRFIEMLTKAGVQPSSAHDFVEQLRTGNVYEIADADDLTVRPGTASGARERVLPSNAELLKSGIDPEEFINPSLGDTMVGYMREMSKTVALASFFGGTISPKTEGALVGTDEDKPYWWPTAKINVALNRAYGRAPVTGGVNNAPRMARADVDYIATKAIPALLGRLGQDLDPTARRWMQNTQAVLNLLLLPLSTLSSLPDMAGALIRSGDFKLAFDGAQRAFLQGSATRAALVQDTELLGFISHSAIDALNAQMYGDNAIDAPFAAKVNHFLFKYNLQNVFTQNTRVMATAVAISWVKDRHARARAGDQQAKDDLIDVLPYRTSTYERPQMLAPASGSETVDKHKIDDVLNALDKFAESGHSVREMEDRASINRAGNGYVGYAGDLLIVRAVLSQFVNESILNPHSGHRPVWASDPKWMLFFHLKQFMYSFHKVILGRLANNFVKAFGARDGHLAMRTAMTALPLLGLAAFALAVRNVVQYSIAGDEPPEDRVLEGGWEYFLNVMQRAGVFGVGQMFMDVYASADRGQIAVLAPLGPTFGKFADVAQSLGQDEDKWSEGTTGEVINNLPGAATLPWLRSMIQNQLD